MTLAVKTRKHGDIDTGYIHTLSYFKLGRYYVPTSEMCKIIEDFARDPSDKSGRVACYSEDYFEKQLFTHLGDAVREGKTAEDSDLVSRLNPMEHVGFLDVEVENKYEGVKIGDYNIPASDFAVMSMYILEGGFFGWKQRGYPKDEKLDKKTLDSIGMDKVKKTKRALKRTKSPLFKSLKKKRGKSK
ncbi:hypothetical protein ACFLZZ_02805 [Nanoarchaeota archaeon]